MNILDIARTCHEANRAVQLATGELDVSPHWDMAPDWQRASAVEGVHAALNGATPEELHESWSASKLSDGWVFGPVKDAVVKTHPCLIPYAELPEGQKTKDRLFRAVVSALAPEGVTP
ncbi:RyR domain-containing protein [Rhodococcus erythropolis]|uniref:RyR domain-containing protein n=1 Tax=Rhodococcus erythropolis TaxID=1833 RepID=UPI0024B92D12|nr:RyR domain-containing protein [Rhodococcus erythropolis]MDJ0404044.1 RyR domain-containing protein [Rhodococcus erythropolis]